MRRPILMIVVSQLIFSISDLLARAHMPETGFVPAAFFTAWFAIYFLIRIVATGALLYAFSQIELGRTKALLSALSIVLANTLGWVFLKEALSPREYAGVALAIAAIAALGVGRSRDGADALPGPE